MRSGKNYRDNVPQISQIFSRLFGERDYVPSDLLAGLILAKARQKHEIEAKKLLGAQIQCGVDIHGRHIYDLSQYGKLAFENSLRFNIEFLETHQKFTELSHFMIYAHAAYGFGAVYLEHGLFYLIRIYLKHLWSRQRTLNTLNETMTIKGDTSWSDRTVYLIEFIKKSKLGRDVEILYINWENDVIKQPFFIGSGSKLIGFTCW